MGGLKERGESAGDQQYLRNWGNKISKNLAQELKDAPRPSGDPSTVDTSLFRNGLSRNFAVKRPFLGKGNGENLHNWTEIQWSGAVMNPNLRFLIDVLVGIYREVKR